MRIVKKPLENERAKIYYEQFDNYHCGGLGTPMYHWSSSKRENMINAIRNQNEKIVYVSYKKDLEQIFEREVVE